MRDWEDLTSRFLEGRERFKILLKIEIAQRKKLQRERDLQGRGRSTLLTYYFMSLNMHKHKWLAQEHKWICFHSMPS